MRLGLLLLSFLIRPVWCGTPVLKVGLAESEAAALKNSATLQAVAGRTQKLGDNESYSIGPTLGWTLWDQGMVKESWKSALADSLRLAQSQYQDIDNRRKAGASSFIDSLSAHQDVLSRARLFRQARTELAEALRDLFALTGAEPQAELSLPLDIDSAAQPPEGTEPASAAVSLDPPEAALAALAPARACGRSSI